MASFSRIALCISIIVLLYTGLKFYPRWNQSGTEATISWDVSGYYMYLPALFIYKDIKGCSFKDTILSKYNPTPDFQQALNLPDGGYVMKYSSGQSLLMAPGFIVGHLWALNSDHYEADGFSFPYHISVGICMLLFSLFGLIIYRKILLQFFSEKVTAITLLSLAAGTNYLNYAAIDQGMTHSSLFTVYAIIIYSTIHFYNKPSNRKAFALGMYCGLATLIRPTEIISLMIPIAWGINTIPSVRERIIYFKDNYKKLILAAIGFIILVSIQLIYWKYATGKWVYYSYDDQGFSFLHPHLHDYILSYQCGWLVYCPMMIIPLIGIFFVDYKKRNIWPLIAFFSLVNLYIVASWDIWWYGGRAMVQSYAMMMFLFAGFTEFALKKRYIKYVFLFAITFFTYLNLWWTYHSHYGTINLSGPNKSYFWKVVGRWNVGRDVERWMDNNEWYEKPVENGIQIYSNDFEKDTSKNAIEQGITGKSIFINKELNYSQPYEIPLPPPQTDMIRVTADVSVNFTEYNSWDKAKLVLKFSESPEKAEQIQIAVDRQLYNGNQGTIYLDARLDKRKINFNKIEYFFWSVNGQKKLIADNVKVVAFKSK